jgi:hypothetical protein
MDLLSRANSLRPDELVFFESYMDETSRTDCYELVHEHVPRTFYLKLDVCEEEELSGIDQDVVEVVVEILQPLVQVKD